MGTQRFELRSEQKNVSLPAVIERLLAEAITRQRQRFRLAVPKRECEHPNCLTKRGFQAPAIERAQQRLRVGVSAPLLIMLRQSDLVTDRQMIVNFAVENDYVS